MSNLRGPPGHLRPWNPRRSLVVTHVVATRTSHREPSPPLSVRWRGVGTARSLEPRPPRQLSSEGVSPLDPEVGPCCDTPTMRVLLGTLWLALACGSVHATLSKSDAKKAASKTLLEKTQFSGKPVHERGLVVTDLRAEDVVLEHRSYCSAKAHKRHFAGDILGYVTPWNRHGYDVAKIFGGKFTHIAPVWLQLKRHGREMFEVTGLDDVDQGWMRAVRKQAKGLRVGYAAYSTSVTLPAAQK
ncbi:Chitinase domain-containing protein 1, partial [Eschrichtius robustus]|nr:Chitinase domain-containing protein 1 [Eschrichtius robustus]